ncbi:Uncharacterised protein [Mycobacteroides abscessus]|nr:Uncharacterised protein [Mycobacteroides abscessus]
MSNTKVSVGDENTRCIAMVSSTTPRFGPRWPPVRETESTRNARISAASSRACPGVSRCTSSGEVIVPSRLMQMLRSVPVRPARQL